MTEEQFWSGLGDYQERILNIITNLSSKTYVGIVNLKNKQTWWSQRVVDFFGLEKGVFDYAMEKSTVKVHPDDRDKYLKGFSDRMQGKHLNERFEYRLMTGKYTCSLFSAYGQIVQDEQGEPALLVLVAENHGISDEIDSVTGLYSEEVFDEHINDMIQRKTPAAILKVGIEQFSRINVLYGVEYANRVLSEVTYLLRCAAADQGFVYRLSGAKFALVFKRKNKEQIQKVYHFIQDSLSDRLYINDKKVPLRIAGGAFILENYTMDAIAVRSRLTYAMNHSRHKHHGELVIYNDEIDSDMHDNLELISVIHRGAIEKREGFFLCYQPIADTKDGEIRGMEALLRWKKEPYGVVPPGVFIEWLEEDPCIFDLGNWIISQALRDLKEISKEKPDFFVNVNISAGQIERKEFRETVLWLLKKSGLKPEQLCMELTERCRELDVNFLKQEIDFFKSKGIKVAMDDFGTGNASLALALDLPVDELKIDMSFVRGIQEKPVKQAMVQSIVSFAQNTKKETCIEGVEDKVLLDYLKKYHATWHQGYYYSRPIPFDEFKTLLHDSEKNNSVKEEIV